MASDASLSILVLWSQQARFISLSADVDLITVENAIRDVYQIEGLDVFREYQIQFYDRVYHTFVDLHAGSLATFQQLLHELRSPQARPNSDQTWQLRVILRATPTARTHAPEQPPINPTSHVDQTSANDPPPGRLRFPFESISPRNRCSTGGHTRPGTTSDCGSVVQSVEITIRHRRCLPSAATVRK